ncbi:unnamed protein product [Choristocarpus tenellus]
MAEWTHPRKASKETISYLTQIEPVLDQYDEDATVGRGGYGIGGVEGDEDGDEDVDQEQMLDNVLDELKHQTASIMEDRQGSVVAEKLARRLTPLQLRLMLSRCGGYMLSLANNRYSSHVLQTLLSLAGQVVEAELMHGTGFVIDTEGELNGAEPDEVGTAGKEATSVDTMQDVILSLVLELSGVWSELMADISGSHTGRAFLQVLGGLPILAEKRGKESRHQHSIETAARPVGWKQEAVNGVGPDVIGNRGGARPPADPEALAKWSTSRRFQIPSSFQETLASIIGELLELPETNLLSLACSTFGCPLLVMLLRVYANLDMDPAIGEFPRLTDESLAMALVRRTLNWQGVERSAQVVYAMSGEGTGSHLMEAIIWLSPDGFFGELYSRCFEGRQGFGLVNCDYIWLYEYCEHGVSNFLVQACLQRVDDKAMATGMVEVLGGRAADLLACRRGGVLWRAAQACVRLGLGAKTQAVFLAEIASAVIASKGVGVDTESHKSEKTTNAFQDAREWVPALLNPQLPKPGGFDRLALNVTGARIVQNIVQFETSVAAPVVKAVASLPEATLAAVAKDNLGSRCLLDPILEVAAAANAGTKAGGAKGRPGEDARRSLLRTYRGNLVAMACDRVAWHVLLKLFRGADMKGKRYR